MEVRVSKDSVDRDLAMGRPRKRTKSDHDSSLDTTTKSTDHIPMDIVKEILQRLPAKSVAKFITVSKSWTTIIHSNYFITSFSLQQSMASQQEPHRLLFGLNETNNSTFFSSSSVNLTTDHEKPPLEFISRIVCPFHSPFHLPIYVKGLLSFTCLTTQTQVICNPSTGNSIVLPSAKTRRHILNRYFGFDPIKAEYKVLCIIDSKRSGDGSGRITPSQNQIFTVGSKTSIWRKLDLWFHHSPISEGICIDGIIYYLAKDFLDTRRTIILVRFDVKSEKFLKQLPCLFPQLLGPLPLWYPLYLINYKSKLAIVNHPSFHYLIDLWVLEDAEKLEWSKISHDISPWISLFTDYVINMMGITPSDEIVYSCSNSRDGYYVLYHDHKKNQHRRIEIKPNMSFVFIDYEESVMFL